MQAPRNTVYSGTSIHCSHWGAGGGGWQVLFIPILALHNYEFFKLSKLLGGGGKRYVCHPNYFHLGATATPAPPPPG